MTPERWRQIEELYHAARERGSAVLAGTDPELRRAVERLLEQDSGGQILDRPAAELLEEFSVTQQTTEAQLALASQTVSHYSIVGKLGGGGMGVVYKAKDLELGRFVALKFLPEELARDAQALKRFRREARAASSLNHPNIITIHEIGEQDGRTFIVMELVDGKPLNELIPRKGMRLTGVLRIAAQVADALTAAHAAGIVHRDLKPANIMVDAQGRVKVLDFGSAKLSTPAAAGAVGPDESTRTVAMDQRVTEAGVIVGSVPYMSPEQAEGKPLDARTDIFSFGAVLYEMITGQRAFRGESRASTLAAIVEKDPQPPSEISSTTPPELERLIVRCLRKDVNRRCQNMADVKLALEELRDESESEKLAPPAAAAHAVASRWMWPGLAIVALVLTMATSAVLWLAHSREEHPPRVVPLTTFAGNETFPSFSPDGNQVVFTWDGEKHDNQDLYVKMIGSATALRLTTDPAPDLFPAWSPDGRQIAFLKGGERTGIYLISPLGGPEQRIADFDGAGAPAWSPDGKFLVVAKPRHQPKGELDEGALFLVPLQGAEPHPLLLPESGLSYEYPAIAPDGRSLAFASCGSAGPECVVSLVGLNPDLLPRGRPRQIRGMPGQIAGMAWTANGRSIVYSAGTSVNDYYLWRLDVAGTEPKRLDIASQAALFPAVAPKGNRLAFARGAGAMGAAAADVALKGNRLAFARAFPDQDIWRLEVGGRPEPFLVSSMLDTNAQFSPDGRRIAFASGRSVDRVAIWLSDANGANLVQLTRGPGDYDGSPRWSPDGRWIAFDALEKEGRRNIRLVDSTGGQPRNLTGGQLSRVPSWSRDGRWIYFTSDRTGQWEIWRTPAQGGVAEQITQDGGYVALESPDGKTLYYTKTGNYSGEPLYARPLGGNEEKQVLDRVAGRGFVVLEDGIYYLSYTSPRTAEIRFHEFATGRSRAVAPIQAPLGLGLSVSPDRKTFLFTEWVPAGSDLMLIENFR